jgi:serine/threonine-protein kinase
VARTETLLRELASGGMGFVEVVARRQGRFLRVHARKRLHPHLRRDPVFRAMFLDEARIAGLVRHGNVVSVIDVGEDEDGPFLLMDLVEGQSLARVLKACGERGRRVPVPIAVRLALDVARGLHAAHEATDSTGRPLGIVHRDVSAQNVLVGYDGVARVTDFGIAKAFGNLTETATGVLKGSMGYLAPEQLRFHEPDRRSDLFSLGVLLYELLAGERLYGQGAEGARRILEELPPDLGAARAEAPAALVELAFQLLAKERELRPATAGEVATRLEEVLANLVEAEGAPDPAAFMLDLFGEERRSAKATLDAALARLEAETTDAAPDGHQAAAPLAVAPGDAKPTPAWRRALLSGLALGALGAAALALNLRTSPTSPPAAATAWAGGWHTCAADGDALYCWGKNNHGQVGSGELRDELLRAKVTGVERPRGVALGLFHTCACAASGELFCWGRGREGQLGLPDRKDAQQDAQQDARRDARRPRRVPLPAPCVAVAAGPRHTCALLGGPLQGRVSCFGENVGGEAGQSPSASVDPTLVPELDHVVEIAANGDNRGAPSGFTCARKRDGTVVCFGDNEFGQLGDRTLAFGPTLRTIPALTDAAGLALGGSFGCALRRDARIRCWGDVSVAHDRARRRVSRPADELVAGLTGVQQLAAGLGHACALLGGAHAGSVTCFGDGSYGQLGRAVPPGVLHDAGPLPMSGISGLALGQVHTCLRHATGLVCAGLNQSGQLGNGTTDESAVPASVAGFAR